MKMMEIIYSKALKQEHDCDVTNSVMLIPNLQLDLLQEIRFLIYSIIHLYLAFESKTGQPRFKNTKLKRVVVLIRHSMDEFTLYFNNCVYSMSFISFVLNISDIFSQEQIYIFHKLTKH